MLTGPLASDLVEAAVLSLRSVTAVKEPTKSPSPQQQQGSPHLCPAHGNTTKVEQQQLVTIASGTHQSAQTVQRRLANHGLDLMAHLLDKLAFAFFTGSPIFLLWIQCIVCENFTFV